MAIWYKSIFKRSWTIYLEGHWLDVFVTCRYNQTQLFPSYLDYGAQKKPVNNGVPLFTLTHLASNKRGKCKISFLIDEWVDVPFRYVNLLLKTKGCCSASLVYFLDKEGVTGLPPTLDKQGRSCPSEIFLFMNDKKICTRITVSVYLCRKYLYVCMVSV